MTIINDIKAEAHNLGFALCGITRPSTPAHFSTYEKWLAAGHHGGMDYLNSSRHKDTRQNPELLFPDVRSIVVVTAPYSQVKESIDPSRGNIAAYALAKDYHLILPGALTELLESINQMSTHPVTGLSFADSAPILEHDLAWMAGLGWIGKNTCLISKQFGSYTFIAELFIDYELEPDEGVESDHCGACTRCMDACPTGCILPDRTIDASRCISYLTIENKGSIPAKLRHKMSNHIYGCDVCQSVCPWNNRAIPPRNYSLFQSKLELAHPDLLTELNLDENGFKQKFLQTPVLRTKRRGYLRNICVALGNAQVTEAIQPLSKLLHQDGEAVIRAHSAWALGQIQHSTSREALSRAILNETDPMVLEEIKNALGT